MQCKCPIWTLLNFEDLAKKNSFLPLIWCLHSLFCCMYLFRKQSNKANIEHIEDVHVSLLSIEYLCTVSIEYLCTVSPPFVTVTSTMSGTVVIVFHFGITIKVVYQWPHHISGIIITVSHLVLQLKWSTNDHTTSDIIITVSHFGITIKTAYQRPHTSLA